MDQISTMFAPAERADMESVLKNVDMFDGSELAHHISNVTMFYISISLRSSILIPSLFNQYNAIYNN